VTTSLQPKKKRQKHHKSGIAVDLVHTTQFQVAIQQLCAKNRLQEKIFFFVPYQKTKTKKLMWV